MAASPDPNSDVASSTDISCTSAMSLPPSVYCSTSALKRRPSHSSHGDSTVAITPSSVKITPAPLQVSHAPSELELNSDAFTSLAFANALRIGSSTPVYVAGLLRREPLMAPWSMTTTPSRPASEPWMRSEEHTSELQSHVN